MTAGSEPLPFMAALDVGGTSIKASAVSQAGERLLSTSIPTERHLGWQHVINRIVEFSQRFLIECSHQLGTQASGLSVAVLGLVDSEAGTLVFSSNVGWRDVPLRAILTEATKMPVTVIHDVLAGAIAEARLGSARGIEDWLYIALGTGVGGAVFINGVNYPGRTRPAGEVGHLVVKPGGKSCGCGGSGCLETVSSAPAVARRYAELGGSPGTELPEILAAAVRGDNSAQEAWMEGVEGLASAICSYSALMAPQLVVVGGGISLAGNQLFSPLRKSITRSFYLPVMPQVVPATLGPFGACVGASLCGWAALTTASR